MSGFLLIINAAVILFNLFVLLPGVWRYGFHWQSLALVIVALTFAVGSTAVILIGSAS